MGVYGLLSHCLERRDHCAEQVDLVETARSRGGIDILVDFYSFEHLLLKNLWQSLSSASNNNLLRILGGEYQAIDAYFKKLVTDLQALDIHLVFYVDGAKGSSKVGLEQKLDTWKRRHRQSIDKLKKLVEVCHKRRLISEAEDASVRPVLLEVQIFTTLQKCNCEIVYCTTGEADFVLAKDLQTRPKAFAIMSNDSDFCIFKNCLFIPNELFDLEGDLRLGGDGVLPEKPVRLRVGVLSSERVASMLQLGNITELVELSIIAGNDFTGPHINWLKAQLGLKNCKIQQLIDWVREFKQVDRHPFVKEQMARNRKLNKSIQQSRDFYGLLQEAEVTELSSPTARALDEGIRSGAFPVSVFGMHMGLYWHRMLLEDCTEGLPCAENALTDLRAHIYRIVLDSRDHSVREYGRRPHEDLGISTVNAVNARWIPSVIYIQPDKVFQNLRTFHRILLHYEPNLQVNFFDRYGRKNGFLCYTLRYLLQLTVHYTLHIDMVEFMALVAMALGTHDATWYQGQRIIPTSRCVTIVNWYQDVYRHAYSFLGHLLHLTHEFPEPYQVFSGSVWTTFYMLSTRQVHLPQADFKRIRQNMDSVIQERRHMISHIVQGFFPFNTKF